MTDLVQRLREGETCEPPLQVPTTGWVAPKNHYAVPVLFNPYTGEPRDVRDVQSDPQGILIVPPGKVEMLAAPPAHPPRREPLPPDAFTVNFMRLTGLDKHTARQCEEIVRLMLGVHE